VLPRYQSTHDAGAAPRQAVGKEVAGPQSKTGDLVQGEQIMTRVLRVPEQVHSQATQIAALRNSQPGHLVADAWREYIENHRDEFAADLEKTAKLLRDGTLEQLTEFTSRNADARAAKAVERLNSKRAESGQADETERAHA
jgi:hypothetical protein